MMLQSEALLGKKHKEVLRIKSSLEAYQAELLEASTLVTEQEQRLQVGCCLLFTDEPSYTFALFSV